jgi:acetyl esterase/lipase
MFRDACKKAGVEATLVEYEKGGHGVGLGTKSDLPLKEWPNELEKWLKANKFLDKK